MSDSEIARTALIEAMVVASMRSRHEVMANMQAEDLHRLYMNTALDAALATHIEVDSSPDPAMIEERCRRFNDQCGVYGYMSERGRTGANLHPDRCVCQNETTPHKHHVEESPFRCARCIECESYTPAIPTSNGKVSLSAWEVLAGGR